MISEDYFANCTMAEEAEQIKDNTNITGLTVNYLSNPIGVETSRIAFSWKMQSSIAGKLQAAYMIFLKNCDGDIVWCSGKVNSGKSVGIPYGGKKLDMVPGYCDGERSITYQIYDVTEIFQKIGWLFPWLPGQAGWIIMEMTGWVLHQFAKALRRFLL